ncbi:internalin putative [Geitlerinema sp. FC II]|nr:internalin putative [Geitlerinema sp. FC II]
MSPDRPLPLASLAFNCISLMLKNFFLFVPIYRTVCCHFKDWRKIGAIAQFYADLMKKNLLDLDIKKPFEWIIAKIQRFVLIPFLGFDRKTLESFSEWCRNRDRLTPDAKHTVEVLLQQARTSECDRAEEKLTTTIDLDLSDRHIQT